MDWTEEARAMKEFIPFATMSRLTLKPIQPPIQRVTEATSLAAKQ